MKKACIVCLCLGLLAASALLISWAGEKDALRREAARVQSSNTALQTELTERQAAWEKVSGDLKQQAEALRQENDALADQLSDANEKWRAARQQAEALSAREQQAADALRKAQLEWNEQVQSLAAQNEALSGRLENALTALLPPDEPPQDLFSAASQDREPEPAAPRARDVSGQTLLIQ